MSIDRPQLPPDFDQSRAAARAADPTGWRLDDDAIQAVYNAIEARRDIRRFRPDPVDAETLDRILKAAHAAPSVGLMQPWSFILIRSQQTKAAMQGIAAKQRLIQAPHLDDRARQYLDLKLEGIREAPLSICVCCDHHPGEEVLGRHSIPDTDMYSTCLAIQNLWLAARAEGVGVGWVSLYDEHDVRDLLGLPDHVLPVAWLCVGYPDERPTRPGLEMLGWSQRAPLSDHVFDERWPDAPPTHTSTITPADHTRAVAARDRSDQLIKPQGSLGVLENLVERWAAATGSPPPQEPRAAILVFAANHGVAAQNVSLYPARVGGQVAAAAARGESAIGVLAGALKATLTVADVGLDTPTQDITAGPALTQEQFATAFAAGAERATAAIQDKDILILGEIGIANTTVASALLAGLTGLSADEVCGRGTGLDSQGLERKRASVGAALAANPQNDNDAIETLRTLGGYEFAALAGAMLAAARNRTPILLDGFAVGVAALAANRQEPALRDYLIAGHRSAEPAHQYVLTELGLEPLLDLRLRLGEASGAALALPLIGLAATVHAQMGTFADSGVDPLSAR